MMYHIQEGGFDLPASPSDRSIQILELGEGPTHKALVIAREPAQVSPSEFLEAFVNAHGRRKPRYKLMAMGPTEVAGLVAHGAAYAWTQEGVAMTSHLIAVQVGDTMLTISVTGLAADREASEALLLGIARTFRCRRPE